MFPYDGTRREHVLTNSLCYRLDMVQFVRIPAGAKSARLPNPKAVSVRQPSRNSGLHKTPSCLATGEKRRCSWMTASETTTALPGPAYVGGDVAYAERLCSTFLSLPPSRKAFVRVHGTSGFRARTRAANRATRTMHAPDWCSSSVRCRGMMGMPSERVSLAGRSLSEAVLARHGQALGRTYTD